MPERSSKKPSKFERSFKIMEYLRKNTDRNHTTTQAKMRKAPGMNAYMGDKETFNDTVVNMAMAMNFNDIGVKTEEEWKIVFEMFKKQYGTELDYENEYLDDEDDNKANERMRIKGLFYNHTFSYEEINCIIEGILFSRTLDTESANRLVTKIEENLTSNYYKKGPKRICTVRETILADRERLRENLLIIQQAIDEGVKISFQFNGYNLQRELMPVRETKDIVSPYYMVANGGRYYLVACKDVCINNEIKGNMSIWRIDLMTEIEIPGRNDKLKIPGIHVLRKEDVDVLPINWDDSFQLSHLNMSYDKPINIKLKIKSPKKNNNPSKRVKVDYTFMYDWFGDTFKYLETEKEVPYDDIVQVKCSPFAMVNWALQYSDRVEVLKPIEVREAVVKKIKNLNKKYGVED